MVRSSLRRLVATNPNNHLAVGGLSSISGEERIPVTLSLSWVGRVLRAMAPKRLSASSVIWPITKREYELSK